MSDLLFTKMQGLGNDFVVIDATSSPLTLGKAQIQRIADRRLGVGCDQVLVLESSEDKGLDFVYRIFNSDGGEVGQCGNGARCVGRFIQAQGLSDKHELTLQTTEGLLKLALLEEGIVKVIMSPPVFSPKDIPYISDQESEAYDLPVDGELLSFSVVNVGNPHAVIFKNDINETSVEKWGRALGAHTSFPEGVNVSVVHVVNEQHVDLCVFERGAGMTKACGSAACAVVAAGRRLGLLDAKVTVSQSGGDLDIHWEGAGENMEMIGPATFVFQGVFHLEN